LARLDVTKAQRTLVRDDARLAVTDWGGDQPVAVLIHGLTGSQREWEAVAARLADRFRVVTYDHRCHGESSRSADHSWSAFVNDLRALLADFELRDVTLVGHSIGAGIALEVAMGDEDCRALVLLDGAFPVPEPQPDGGRFHVVVRSLWMFSIRMRTLRRGHSLSSSEVRQVGNEYRGRSTAFDRALQSVECPTTFILGSLVEHGRAGPAFQVTRQEAAARVSAANPRIRVQWIEARHDMLHTQPQEIADAVIRLQTPA
jgi:pimeloyl-ACP methyl ester carboxylesterase